MALLHLLCLLLAVANIHAQKSPNTVAGRSVIVHLFEWKFIDVALECERFLGPRGFAGVQVSPVHENIVLSGRPWYERYQVISYNIISRSGNLAAFVDMVTRCNNVGVRIYVDVVLNHMTGDYTNANGTGGCTADTYNKYYPCVPYVSSDFNTPCSVNLNDPYLVRNCKLNGDLHDLNQALPNVRQKILDYLNLLISYGIAGFRIDNAKHMWPADLQYIYSRLNNLNTAHGFATGTRPFIYQDVKDFQDGAVRATEYTPIGRVEEYKYGKELGNAFRGNNPIKYLINFGEPWGFIPSGDALVFVDSHTNQREGLPILTYKDAKLYKMVVAFKLAFPFGYPRIISSYSFTNSDVGPPHDGYYNILSPIIYSDGTCGNGWVCEHRWRQIYNMVEFLNVVTGYAVINWWDNGDKQIAFGRGGRGFIAFNNQYNTNLNVNLQTGLPAGNYCDVISGSKSGGTCTGKTVYVNSSGVANIVIGSSEEDGVLAIHAGSKL